MLPINKREGKREIISSFVRGMWPLGIGRCRSSKFCMSLILTAVPNIFGWLAISIAKDTSLLFMGRWLKGFGVRIISYVPPLQYIARCSLRVQFSNMILFHL
ncbi:hypothetical protein GLYMA_18G095850v4 [Glycine max]|nr:hypothetical protein GLYMA_18G095850v4 [Glycine max]KAH1153886.1 hypothetical protein GYH30_049496 [Glycine max]